MIGGAIATSGSPFDDFDFEVRKRFGQSLLVTSKKYPFRAACKSDSKNLFGFGHRERVRWGNWVSLI
jgi:hypothetical protein